MKATILYTVHAEVNPEIETDYIRWLEGGHIDTVLTADGFLWARKMTLEERAPDGWLKLMVHYGISNREALKRYHEGALYKSFAREVERFNGHFRVTRSIGTIDFEASV